MDLNRFAYVGIPRAAVFFGRAGYGPTSQQSSEFSGSVLEPTKNDIVDAINKEASAAGTHE